MITKIIVHYVGHKGMPEEFVIRIKAYAEYAHLRTLLDALLDNKCDMTFETETPERVQQ